MPRMCMTGVALIAFAGALLGAGSSEPPESPVARGGNPVFPGWYADPEGVVIDGRVWIYPTFSAPYNDQLHFDAFSSDDLVTWTKHERILTSEEVWWARRAMWAPAMIAHRGRFFLFFAANDIQNDREVGGIGIAVADKPEGPFKDHLGKPIIDRFHNGAQPIDQFVFKDIDGTHYMFYGGWRHCNVVKLNDEFTGLVPFEDGTVYREVTPEGYVEGPFMLRRVVNGKPRYYFMWSEGGWTGPDYSVAYAIADSPLGPFKRIGKILEQDPTIATGAGHHSVIALPGASGRDAKREPPAGQSPEGAAAASGADSDQYFIVYHRRPLGQTDRNHRVVCIDRLDFDEQGLIKPVKMTLTGSGGLSRVRRRSGRGARHRLSCGMSAHADLVYAVGPGRDPWPTRRCTRFSHRSSRRTQSVRPTNSNR